MRSFWGVVLLLVIFPVKNVFSSDPFEPLKFQVGEDVVRQVLADPSKWGVSFSQNTPETAIARSTGATAIVPLVTKIDQILRTAITNSSPGVLDNNSTTTNSTTSNSTATNTSSYPSINAPQLIEPVQALQIAQSGAALHAILNEAGDFGAGDTLILMRYFDTFGFQFFNPLSLRLMSFSDVSNFRQSLSSKFNSLNQVATPYSLTILNIYPLSDTELKYRKNHMDVVYRVGCGNAVTSKSLNVSCFSGVGWKLSFGEPNSSNPLRRDQYFSSWDALVQFVNSRVDIYLQDNPGETRDKFSKYCFDTKFFTESESNSQQSDDQDNPFCFPYIGALPSPVDKNLCPIGTVFFGGHPMGNLQLCSMEYSPLQKLYESDIFPINVRHFPLYEIIDKSISINPFELKFRHTAYDSSSTDRFIFGDFSLSNNAVLWSTLFGYSMSAFFAYKPIDGGFAFSKTLSGVILVRNFVESILTIREITEYDYDFKLLNRRLSFETSDGYDLAPFNTSLSSKTFGSSGESIGSQFGILNYTLYEQLKKETLPLILDKNVPCGLGKVVTVLRSKVENGNVKYSFEKVPSPPCKLNTGKIPTYPIRSKEDEQKEIKKIGDDFKSLHTKVLEYFRFSAFPTSNRCAPLVVEAPKVPALDGVTWLNVLPSEFVFSFHCDVLEKHPSLDDHFRLFSQIIWFLLALFRIFST